MNDWRGRFLTLSCATSCLNIVCNMAQRTTGESCPSSGWHRKRLRASCLHLLLMWSVVCCVTSCGLVSHNNFLYDNSSFHYCIHCISYHYVQKINEGKC